jgi:hypothetical protein
MTWLAWRQLRTQAVTVAAALAGVAVLLAVTGPRLAGLTGDIFSQLTPTDRFLYWAGVVVVGVAPALLGAFWGAPLVARELETGTHRLAWSQTVTRGRWLAAKLGLAVLGAALAAGLLTLAVGWWAAPLDGVTGDQRGSLPVRLSPVPFAMRGVVPVAYAVFAVVLGTVAGMLLRRSVAAMAVTLALVAAVQVTVPLWVRPHLLPPERAVTAISADRMDGLSIGPDGSVLTLHTGQRGDWLLSSRTLDPAGRPVPTLPEWFPRCLPGPGAGGPNSGTARQALRDCLARLDAAGYRQEIVYHPVSRFWPLQWAELALYLAGAGLLAGFGAWWLRRLG